MHQAKMSTKLWLFGCHGNTCFPRTIVILRVRVAPEDFEGGVAGYTVLSTDILVGCTINLSGVKQ